MSWTLFWDMHSGGQQKELWSKIYIEAPKGEAVVIFYNRFGHNPNRVTCTCCGEDYSICESETLEEASAYHRGCRWIHEIGDKFGDGRYIEPGEEIPDGFELSRLSRIRCEDNQTLEEYRQNKDVLVIPASEIKPKERTGEVPEQGYVWVD